MDTGTQIPRKPNKSCIHLQTRKLHIDTTPLLTKKMLLNAMLPNVIVANTMLPNVTVPNTMLPNVTVPNTMLPNLTVPNAMLPNVTVPNTMLSNVSVPNTMLPNVTLLVSIGHLFHSDQSLSYSYSVIVILSPSRDIFCSIRRPRFLLLYHPH